MAKAQLWSPGHHDAGIPKETLWRQQDPHHLGRALPVYLHLHQDLGKVGSQPGEKFSDSPLLVCLLPTHFLLWRKLLEGLRKMAAAGVGGRKG